MAVIGQQLIQPESGWKRYDDTSPEIKKQGQLVNTGSGTGKYKVTSTPLTEALPKIYFDFIGEEIVIRSFGNYGIYKVTIDGIDVGNSNVSGSTSYEVTFIKSNLSPGRHKVELQWVNSTVYIDSIDVKNEGRLLHPDEVLTIGELEIGKRIRAHYTAATNQVGYFSGLGKENSEFIPPTSSATPNGDFYFVMVEDWNGKKKLISDRNIAHTISWDILNSDGIASGTGRHTKMLEISNESITVGGTVISSTSRAGFPATGAFDSDQSTYWVSAEYGASVIGKWIGYDFGTPKEIREITYVPFSTTNGRVLDIDVESSDDGTVWTVVNSFKSLPNIAGSNEIILPLPKSKKSRYWRMVARSGTTGVDNYWYIFNIKMKESLPKYTSFNFIIRLSTGGINVSDKDNEWDQYIAGSSLGGTITPGDQSVWNALTMRSWTSTTETVTNSTNRVARGSTANGSVADRGFNPTNAANTGYGFRPVLEIESLFSSKFLIDDGGVLKTYLNNSWQSLGLSTATPELFELYGMDSLSLIDDTSIKLLASDNPKVMVLSKASKAKLKVTHTPRSQTVIGQKDVDISLVESLTSNLTFTKGPNSIFRIIVSTNKGSTWQAFNSTTSSWETVQLANISTEGINVDAFNTLTIENWKPLIEDSDYLRFAYYLDYHETETVTVDNHDVQLDMHGAWRAAVHGFDYDYDYPRTGKLRVYLYKDGNYKINY